jgi:hypothetical protein
MAPLFTLPWHPFNFLFGRARINMCQTRKFIGFLSCLALLLASLACSVNLSIDPTNEEHPTKAASKLRATFIGQDGSSYAGKQCSSGTINDNVHIRLSGLRTEITPVSFRVDDYAKGGVWSTPCDPVSNWFLFVNQAPDGMADLYFKPFRDAPAGTEYRITVGYSNGETQTTIVRGSQVKQKE